MFLFQWTENEEKTFLISMKEKDKKNEEGEQNGRAAESRRTAGYGL